MAEVSWQARRTSDSVLVDVTADIEGSAQGAPTPNPIEGGGGIPNPVTTTLTSELEEDGDNIQLNVIAGQTGFPIEVQQASGEELVLFTVGPGGQTGITNDATDAPGLVVSQWAELDAGEFNSAIFRVDSTEVTRVFVVDRDGRPRIRVDSAPLDADLITGQLALWFDTTPGSAKLMIKGKNSSGTVVTGSVNLT